MAPPARLRLPFVVTIVYLVLLCASQAADPRTILLSPPYSPRQADQSARCFFAHESPSIRKPVQNNGTADDEVSFSLCPSATSGSVNALTLSHASSAADVLPVSPPEISAVMLDRVAAEANACSNVTAVFTFDAMVGVTVYRLYASDSDTDEELCSTEITFLVVGFSVYEDVSTRGAPELFATFIEPVAGRLAQTRADDQKIIFSGDGRIISSSYEDTLESSTKSFRMRVQRADGQSPSTSSREVIDDMLKDFVVESFFADASSPVQYRSECVLTGPLQNAEATSFEDLGCGVSVALISQPSGQFELKFVLRYDAYRDGVSIFLFQWDSLVSGDADLLGEGYVNVVEISVGGDPPPYISAFIPPKSMRRTGGDQITVIMDNVDSSDGRYILVGGKPFLEVKGSFRKRPDGLYEAKYVTEAGTGTNLDWQLYAFYPTQKTRSAVLDDLLSKDSLSYSTTPLRLSAVEPLIGLPGREVTLAGYFDGFDPTNPTHNVFVGIKSLRSLNVVPSVNADGTEIVFRVPDRLSVGASFQYPVRVIVNAETTSSSEFTFEPPDLNVAINVYGGSYDEEREEYEIGACAVTNFVASLTTGVSDPTTFNWRVVDASDSPAFDLLQNINNDRKRKKTLVMLPKDFVGREGSFEVLVSCSVNGRRLSTSVAIRKVGKPVIGVSLEKQQSRSIAVPDVPVRISAIITPPTGECYNGSKIVYRWTYANLTKEFSYRNFSEPSFDVISTPSRLGREYIIPQSSLLFGNETVNLEAYMEEDRFVSGFASTVLSIVHAPLVPIIGYGAHQFLHCLRDELFMTGQRSYDPDAKYFEDQNSFTYTWTCRASRFLHNLTYTEPCEDTILPNVNAESFTVSTENLADVRSRLFGQEKEQFYILYSLQVSSGLRMSQKRIQTVEVVTGDFEVSKLTGLRLVDNRGHDVDWDRVRPHDDLLIIPAGKQSSWSFSVISPSLSSLMLSKPQNLILHPGYFDPSLASSLQSTPLGIQRGTLQPVEEYEILITVSSHKPGVERGETIVKIRTEDSPALILSDLPVTSGNTETVFSSFAQVNLDSTYEFLFYFYLVTEEDEEYCLAGCSGRSLVQFMITETGTYQILVRLTDIHGKQVLDESLFSQNVTVVTSSSEVTVGSSDEDTQNFEMLMRNSYYRGDHGTYELLASSLASKIRNSMMTSSLDNQAKVLNLAVDKMHQIVQNSIPTTMTAKSYVQTASRFVAVDANLLASQKTLYRTFSMVDSALNRVPPTEALDIQDEVLLFYNLSARHVARAFSGSSSRVRLQQYSTGSDLGGGTVLIDFYRLQEEHLTVVLSRDIECGMIKHVDTVVKGGNPAEDINRFVVDSSFVRTGSFHGNSSFDTLDRYAETMQSRSHSTFTLAAICNPAQAKGVRAEATNFSWCDEVFLKSNSITGDETGSLDPTQRNIFTVMETMDYAWMSRTQTGEVPTDTEFLISTNVSVVASDGVDHISLPEIHDCYTVETAMKRLGATPNGGCLLAEGFIVQIPRGSLQPRDVVHIPNNNYSALKTSLSSDGTSSVRLTASKSGVFGAHGRHCPVSARKPILTLSHTSGATFVYVLLGGMVSSVAVVGVTWVATSAAYVNIADTLAL